MHVDPTIILVNFTAFILLIIERTYLKRKVKQLQATTQQMEEQLSQQRKHIEQGTLAMFITTNMIKQLSKEL